jgi:hypothetical protein
LTQPQSSVYSPDGTITSGSSRSSTSSASAGSGTYGDNPNCATPYLNTTRLTPGNVSLNIVSTASEAACTVYQPPDGEGEGDAQSEQHSTETGEYESEIPSSAIGPVSRNGNVASGASVSTQQSKSSSTVANQNVSQLVGGTQSATANASLAQTVLTTSGSGNSTSATLTRPGAFASGPASQASSASTPSISQNSYRRSAPSQQQKTTAPVVNSTVGNIHSQIAHVVIAQTGSSAQFRSAPMIYRPTVMPGSIAVPNYFSYAPRPNATAPARLASRSSVNAGQQFYRSTVAPGSTVTPNYSSYTPRPNAVAPASKPNYQQFASRPSVNAGQQLCRPAAAPRGTVAANCSSSAPRPNINVPTRRSR